MQRIVRAVYTGGVLKPPGEARPRALRRVFREEVRKALLEAMLELVPYVDEEEQRELDEILGEPKDYSEENFEKANMALSELSGEGYGA